MFSRVQIYFAVVLAVVVLSANGAFAAYYDPPPMTCMQNWASMMELFQGRVCDIDGDCITAPFRRVLGQYVGMGVPVTHEFQCPDGTWVQVGTISVNLGNFKRSDEDHPDNLKQTQLLDEVVSKMNFDMEVKANSTIAARTVGVFDCGFSGGYYGGTDITEIEVRFLDGVEVTYPARVIWGCYAGHCGSVKQFQQIAGSPGLWCNFA